MKDSTLEPRYATSWALVIGINAYKHTNPLAIARADAESVAAVLTGELGFPKANVVTLLDLKATRARIMERFLAFDSLAPDDRLLVFFAGHGATFEGQRGPIGYLVPVDGKPDDKSTLIRWDELTRDADLIPAKHILFVMDACYSGLAIQRGAGIGEQRFVSDMLQRRSRQVVTAGKADEAVADSGPTGTNSIFTGYLLEGLRGKAANDGGVLTASYLMNYVYQKVSNDPRSGQTPHFGHLDGDGDFVLRTPNGEHLSAGPTGDFLVKPVVERPEPQIVHTPPLKPVFAARNGYSDPDSEKFGRNEWSAKLACYSRTASAGNILIRPNNWLSLVVEPVSNQPIEFDIAALAKTLPNRPSQSEKPFDRFRVPSQAITTSKSVLFFDSENNDGQQGEDYWKRFLRIEKSGAMEFCETVPVAGIWSGSRSDSLRLKVFQYVQLVGTVWSFLYAVKRIMNIANYGAGVRYMVNLIGTKDSILVQFAGQDGADGKHWRQPFDPMADSYMNWRCRDANLQIVFQMVLSSLSEPEAKTMIVECAQQLGLAYNHQSAPRCFTHGTDVFPWEQYNLNYQ